MSTTTAQREYKLAADPIIRKGIEPMRQIVELTDGGAHLVVAVVPNAYAMDVLEAIRRAYTDGREDRDDGPDPLDGRLLGMARILRETGNGNAADEIEIAANMPDAKTWWRNFLGDGAPMTLTLDGIEHSGHAVAHRDENGRVTVRVRLAGAQST